MRDPYPPEFDRPCHCEVCGEHVDTCDCPECPECGAVGDFACYDGHGLTPAHDSVASLCEHIGVSDSLKETLRLVDKYNIEHIWVVLPDKTRAGVHGGCLDQTHRSTRLRAVGVGGIAWDGSDWEFSEEVEAGKGWAALSRARENFHDALEEWNAQQDAEYEAEQENLRKINNEHTKGENQ